jgi:hypothetical protein
MAANGHCHRANVSWRVVRIGMQNEFKLQATREEKIVSQPYFIGESVYCVYFFESRVQRHALTYFSCGR